MRHPEILMSLEASMPLSSSLQSWLRHELELRGIDAVIYTRYIISLLQQDLADLDFDVFNDIDDDKFFSYSASHGLDGSRKIRGKKSDRKKYSVLNEEEQKKSAAVRCLQAVSDEDSGIVSLVDELCARLKQLNLQKDTLGSSKQSYSSSNLHNVPDVDSNICVDPTQRYYAAFPALQGVTSSDTSQLSQLSPTALHSAEIWSRNPITSHSQHASPELSPLPVKEKQTVSLTQTNNNNNNEYPEIPLQDKVTNPTTSTSSCTHPYGGATSHMTTSGNHRTNAGFPSTKHSSRNFGISSQSRSVKRSGKLKSRFTRARYSDCGSSLREYPRDARVTMRDISRDLTWSPPVKNREPEVHQERERKVNSPGSRILKLLRERHSKKEETSNSTTSVNPSDEHNPDSVTFETTELIDDSDLVARLRELLASPEFQEQNTWYTRPLDDTLFSPPEASKSRLYLRRSQSLSDDPDDSSCNRSPVSSSSETVTDSDSSVNDGYPMFSVICLNNEQRLLVSSPHEFLCFLPSSEACVDKVTTEPMKCDGNDTAIDDYRLSELVLHALSSEHANVVSEHEAVATGHSHPEDDFTKPDSMLLSTNENQIKMVNSLEISPITEHDNHGGDNHCETDQLWKSSESTNYSQSTEEDWDAFGQKTDFENESRRYRALLNEYFPDSEMDKQSVDELYVSESSDKYKEHLEDEEEFDDDVFWKAFTSDLMSDSSSSGSDKLSCIPKKHQFVYTGWLNEEKLIKTSDSLTSCSSIEGFELNSGAVTDSTTLDLSPPLPFSLSSSCEDLNVIIDQGEQLSCWDDTDPQGTNSIESQLTVGDAVNGTEITPSCGCWVNEEKSALDLWSLDINSPQKGIYATALFINMALPSPVNSCIDPLCLSKIWCDDYVIDENVIKTIWESQCFGLKSSPVFSFSPAEFALTGLSYVPVFSIWYNNSNNSGREQAKYNATKQQLTVGYEDIEHNIGYQDEPMIPWIGRNHEEDPAPIVHWYFDRENESLSLDDYPISPLYKNESLSKSFELVPSETSAFADVVPKKVASATALFDESEPVSVLEATGDDNSDSQSSDDDDDDDTDKEDEGSESEHLYFSPKTHFKPIVDLEDTQTSNANIVGTETAVDSESELCLQDLFGGCSPAHGVGYQQYYATEHCDDINTSFVPKFRIEKKSEKCVQTNDVASDKSTPCYIDLNENIEEICECPESIENMALCRVIVQSVDDATAPVLAEECVGLDAKDHNWRDKHDSPPSIDGHCVGDPVNIIHVDDNLGNSNNNVWKFNALWNATSAELDYNFANTSTIEPLISPAAVLAVPETVTVNPSVKITDNTETTVTSSLYPYTPSTWSRGFDEPATLTYPVDHNATWNPLLFVDYDYLASVKGGHGSKLTDNEEWAAFITRDLDMENTRADSLSPTVEIMTPDEEASQPSNASHLVPVPNQAVYSTELEQQWIESDMMLQAGRQLQLTHQDTLPSKGKMRTKRKPCTFFMDGNCRRADCKFSHDLSTITCRFWEDGDCFKGELCPFMHGYPSGDSTPDTGSPQLPPPSPAVARSISVEWNPDEFPELIKKPPDSEHSPNVKRVSRKSLGSMCKKGLISGQCGKANKRAHGRVVGTACKVGKNL